MREHIFMLYIIITQIEENAQLFFFPVPASRCIWGITLPVISDYSHAIEGMSVFIH